jgi:hypothetical protein
MIFLPHGILQQQVVGEAESQLVTDTFTDSNGTGLSSHTPDVDSVGGGWIEDFGSGADIQILSNKAEQTDNVPTYPGGVAFIDVGVADCSLSGVWRSNPTFGTNGGMVVRATDKDNGWYIRLQNAGVFEILERIAGSDTQRASVSPTVNLNTDYTITVQLSGTTITAQLDGGNEISYSSASFNQTETKHGIHLRRGGDKFDNLSITG